MRGHLGLACEEAPSGVRLEVVRGEIPDGWDALVQQDPAAGFFQTAAWWRSALAGWRGGRPFAVVAYRGEDLVGGVAAVERGRGPLRRIALYLATPDEAALSLWLTSAQIKQIGEFIDCDLSRYIERAEKEPTGGNPK